MSTKTQLEKQVKALSEHKSELERRINDSILVPVQMADDLLAAISRKGLMDIVNIGNTVRALAEDQKPDRFKSHRNS